MCEFVFDKKAVVMVHGPRLHMVGPCCAQEIFEDGRKGNLVFVRGKTS
jgi:hypothetical protein